MARELSSLSVPVDVYIHCKTEVVDGNDGRYWHKSQTTMSRSCADSDELWKFLMRHLSFAEWRRCDFTTLDFDGYTAAAEGGRGLWAQCAGINSWEIHDVCDPVDEAQMKSFCARLQTDILEKPFFCSNGTPKKLLVVLNFMPQQ